MNTTNTALAEPPVMGERSVRSSRPAPKWKLPTTRAYRIVRNLTWANLGVLSLIAWLIFSVSETWWISDALLFLPRSPYALPALILLGLSAIHARRYVWVNLLSIAIVVGPMMELQLPLSAAAAAPAEQQLTLVSCNVQAFQPNFGKVLREISQIAPDVVAFQEAYGGSPLLETYFADWHIVHVGEFWVGSRYPLKHISTCTAAAYDRETAISVEIDAPQGRFRLFNVHLMTPRRGLSELGPKSALTGAAAEEIDRHAFLREDEAFTTRTFVAAHKPSLPELVVGDFNMTVSSSIFDAAWGDLQNAFSIAGTGYGYTSPCRSHRVWPDDCPWARIDHILASPRWGIEHCRVGVTNGSDHRLVAAVCHLEASFEDAPIDAATSPAE